MKCSDLRPLLSAYANDELPRTQKEFVEEHLAHCLDCRAALADFRVTRQQLQSSPAPVLPDIREATMSRIRTKMKRTGFVVGRWLVTAVCAFVIVVTLTTVAAILIHDNDSQSVLAKAYTATEAVHSYRSTTEPFIHIEYPDGVVNLNREINAVWEFVLPDRIHLTVQYLDTMNEYIFIGDSVYYQPNQTFTIVFPGGFYSSIPPPSKEKTLAELKSLSYSAQLPDTVLDDIGCYHHEGAYQQGDKTIKVEYWISKKDYLIRQIKRTYQDGSTGISRYYDFNDPITIEAPVDENGKTLPGWLDNSSSYIDKEPSARTTTTAEPHANPTTTTTVFK